MPLCMQSFREAGKPVVIRCKACGWQMDFNPYMLVREKADTLFGNIGWLTPVSEYVHRLKCRICGKREAEIPEP